MLDFDSAIRQRNAAALSNDSGELSAAQQRLELILWNQKETLGMSDARTLVTQRELVTTSVANGLWNGKTLDTWTEQELVAVGNGMRQAYDGLEKTLGPANPDTVEALALLLGLRVSLLDKDSIPLVAMTALLDTLQERCGGEEEKPTTLQGCIKTIQATYKVNIPSLHAFSVPFSSV